MARGKAKKKEREREKKKELRRRTWHSDPQPSVMNGNFSRQQHNSTLAREGTTKLPLRHHTLHVTHIENVVKADTFQQPVAQTLSLLCCLRSLVIIVAQEDVVSMCRAVRVVQGERNMKISS